VSEIHSLYAALLGLSRPGSIERVETELNGGRSNAGVALSQCEKKTLGLPRLPRRRTDHRSARERSWRHLGPLQFSGHLARARATLNAKTPDHQLCGSVG